MTAPRDDVDRYELTHADRMAVDPGLERLRAEFPLGSRVRVSTGWRDQGVHTVIGHERGHHPFSHCLVLRLRTPQGEVTLQRAQCWRPTD